MAKAKKKASEKKPEVDENQDTSADEKVEEEPEEEGTERKFGKLINPKDDAEYIAGLEEKYSQSSGEGVRLSQENKELKAKIDEKGETTSESPQGLSQEDQLLLQEMRAERQQQFTRSWGGFVQKHPEVADDKVAQDALSYLLPSIKAANPSLPYDQALEIAYQATQNPAVQQKIQKTPETQSPGPAQQKAAEQGTTSGGMPPKAAPKETSEGLTETEKTVAQEVGLTEKQYLQGKKLTKQAQQ